jgi:uncharacterized protein (DUF2344 family)
LLSFAEKTKQTDPDLTFTETKLIESPSSASKTNKTRLAITTPEKMSQPADKEAEEEDENILSILFRLEINSIQMTLYEEESFSVILNRVFLRHKIHTYYILNLKKDKINLFY